MDKSRSKAGLAQAQAVKGKLPKALLEDCAREFGQAPVDQALAEFKARANSPEMEDIKDPIPWFRLACANIAVRGRIHEAETDWTTEKAAFKAGVEALEEDEHPVGSPGLPVLKSI